jgi:hypothetical protein
MPAIKISGRGQGLGREELDIYILLYMYVWFI